MSDKKERPQTPPPSRDRDPAPLTEKWDHSQENHRDVVYDNAIRDTLPPPPPPKP